jgi:hypothetical protein
VTKETKSLALYRQGTDARHCSICTMFVAPRSCTKVAGVISPRALCRYFAKKRNVAANIREMMGRGR